MTMSQSEIYTLAKSVGLTDSRAKVAAAIAMAESSGDPNAHNAKPPDDSYGLWQINMLGSLGPARREQFGISDNSALYSPELNAAAMKAISQQGGNFSPWSTYTNGSYRKYLDSAVSDTGSSTLPASNDEGLLDKLNPLDGVVEFGNKIGGWVSNSDNWVRVAYVAGGSVVVIVGLVMLVGSTSAGKAAMNLIPAGKLAKAAKAVS